MTGIGAKAFWVTVCLAAVYCTEQVLLGNLYNFEHHAVSFGMDTSYLQFNTNFPSFSICEEPTNKRITELGEKIYGNDHNLNLDSYLNEIAFYRGVCYSCSSHCGKAIECNGNFEEVVNMVRSPCKLLIDNCSYNGKPFECCDHFLLLRTEMGPCFTINSDLTERKERIDMTLNRVTGPGKMEFTAHEKIIILLHSSEDVPFFNHQDHMVIPLGVNKHIYFQVKEIDNDPSLRFVSVHQRNCRFPDECDLDVYSVYSYSACVVECRARAQVKYCNCTQPLIPKIHGVESCDMEGLRCLNNLTVVETLRALRTDDYVEKKGLVCDCVPSCNEPEYTILYSEEDENVNSNGLLTSKVTLVMESLPTERFKRNVVRTQLDLVVSMGGTIGLFLGASVLSIFELLYYFFLRKTSRTEGNVKPSKHYNRQPLRYKKDIDFIKLLSSRKRLPQKKQINMVIPYLP